MSAHSRSVEKDIQVPPDLSRPQNVRRSHSLPLEMSVGGHCGPQIPVAHRRLALPNGDSRVVKIEYRPGSAGGQTATFLKHDIRTELLDKLRAPIRIASTAVISPENHKLTEVGGDTGTGASATMAHNTLLAIELHSQSLCELSEPTGDRRRFPTRNRYFLTYSSCPIGFSRHGRTARTTGHRPPQSGPVADEYRVPQGGHDPEPGPGRRDVWC